LLKQALGQSGKQREEMLTCQQGHFLASAMVLSLVETAGKSSSLVA
jgi:hypothetical protein